MLFSLKYNESLRERERGQCWEYKAAIPETETSEDQTHKTSLEYTNNPASKGSKGRKMSWLLG